MAIVVDISLERSLDDLQDQLSAHNVRRHLGDVLDEAARLGAVSAETYAPERSGRLKRAISSTAAKLQADGSLEAQAGVERVRALAGGRLGPQNQGVDEYPAYVHEGTGLFGRFGVPITPTRASVMRFLGKTGLVFRAQVAGQRAQPYVREAYEDVNAYLPQRLDEMARRIVHG